MNSFVLDRFEGGFAVLEDENGELHNFPRENFPEHSREGDIFTLENGLFKLDSENTQKKHEQNRSLLDDLFK
jgi:hypothetical protein